MRGSLQAKTCVLLYALFETTASCTSSADFTMGGSQLQRATFIDMCGVLPIVVFKPAVGLHLIELRLYARLLPCLKHGTDLQDYVKPPYGQEPKGCREHCYSLQSRLDDFHKPICMCHSSQQTPNTKSTLDETVSTAPRGSFLPNQLQHTNTGRQQSQAVGVNRLGRKATTAVHMQLATRDSQQDRLPVLYTYSQYVYCTLYMYTLHKTALFSNFCQ